MAWDSKSARRRQGSIVSGAAPTRSIPFHSRQQSKQLAIQPKSSHVADPFLQDFLDPSFDPVTYLNSVLPPLQGSSSFSQGLLSASSAAARSSGGYTSSSHHGGGSAAAAPVPLAELSSQAQTAVSQLNIHTTRLTNTLTQLTDEILRSGSRLAYEVELLRGETLGLAETLTEGLHDDIVKFVPEGIPGDHHHRHHTGGGGGGTATATTSSTLQSQQPPPPDDSSSPDTKKVQHPQQQPRPGEGEEEEVEGEEDSRRRRPTQPPYITQLRTLTLVRSRLDSVIKTFGEAMEFVFPPSEVSVSSSFLSVSAPEPGSDSHSTEEKGKRVLQQLRDEVTALANNTSGSGIGIGSGPGARSGGSDPVKGVEDAARRVEELKELSRVWHGTAEEKGRTRFVESLARIVEERHRELLRELEAQSRRDGADTGAGARGDADGGAAASAASSGKKGSGGSAGDGGGGQAASDSRGYSGGYGFISQLQKIRGGL